MDTIKQYFDYPLAPATSFKSGGNAKEAIIVPDVYAFEQAIDLYGQPDWVLGYGSNSLVSDEGLPGRTYLLKGGDISQDDTLIVADAGVWWDDLVQYAMLKNLWGLECTSQIPGGVGAAIVGNIAAYGQAVSDTLEWAEIYDKDTNSARRYKPDELGFMYRASTTLQTNRQLIVLRAAFRLSAMQTKPLEYESALVHARNNEYDVTTLEGVRSAIIKAREAAGSLWDYRDPEAAKTAGSFFRNPLVNSQVAEKIMASDETGKSLELLKKMNTVHGGEASRVSAAHVLLAAGFERGQQWGQVRLHPQHVLKIENIGDALSQDIHDVAEEIVETVKTKLQVEIVPEVRYLGSFTNRSAADTV